MRLVNNSYQNAQLNRMEDASSGQLAQRPPSKLPALRISMGIIAIGMAWNVIN